MQTSHGGGLPAEHHGPQGAATGLVVIAYGSDGLTDDLGGPWKTMIRGYAQSLAEQGARVIIPDYLAATGTPPGAAVFDVMAQCRAAWETALARAIDQAVAESGVDPAHVGLLGFSLGGHLVLRLRGKARVLVEFFAPFGDGIGPAGGSRPVHAQIHHGEADSTPGTGFENAGAVERTLAGEGTAVELFGYPGAGHGFIGNDMADRNARDAAKARTLSFFRSHL